MLPIGHIRGAQGRTHGSCGKTSVCGLAWKSRVFISSNPHQEDVVVASVLCGQGRSFLMLEAKDTYIIGSSVVHGFTVMRIDSGVKCSASTRAKSGNRMLYIISFNSTGRVTRD
jgi:hypothetical protein